MKSIQSDTCVTVTLDGRRSGMARRPSRAIMVKPAIEVGPESGQADGGPQVTDRPLSLLPELAAAERGWRRRSSRLSPWKRSGSAVADVGYLGMESGRWPESLMSARTASALMPKSRPIVPYHQVGLG